MVHWFVRSILSLLLAVYLPSAVLAFTPQVLNARGVALMQKGEYGEALEPLRQALEALPYERAIRGNLAECYLRLGFQYLKERRFVKAADTFREGRAHADDDARFWLYRGLALLLQGERDAAEGDLQEALAMDGENPQVHQLLGRLFYETGRLRQAIEAWERALELAPDNPEVVASLDKARRELPVEDSMSHEDGGNFRISYDGEVAGEVGDRVLEVLESAYNEVGIDLNFYPDIVVPVLLYTDRDFSEITRSPDWAGGLYDGKIRIPVGGISRITPELKAILYHEYSHVAVHCLSRGRCPVWLNEGLAGIAERRHCNPPLTALADAASSGRLLSPSSMEASFAGLPREEALLAYEQSYSLTAYMVERFQWYKMDELLANLAEGISLENAIQEVFGEYGIDYASLQADWRRQLGRGL